MSRGFLLRPWGILALFAALVLGGLFSWPRLGVDLLPPLPQPVLTVATVYENAPPQEVEALVTRRLESVLGTVTGVTRMESVSREGLSNIKLIFTWGQELDPAAAEVREKLDTVVDQLPKESDPPLVLRYDPSQAPVLTLALTGQAAPLAMRVLAEDRLKTRLETIEGVAAVRVNGGLSPEVQVLADRGRLVALKLDLATLIQSIEAANLNSPAGDLEFKGLEVPVRTVGRFVDPAQIGEVPLSQKGQGTSVTMEQVAQVVLTHKDRTGFCQVDQKPAVLLSVLKRPGANTVEVSRRVRAEAERLGQSLGQGLNLEAVDDQAPFIEQSLAQLGQMVLWGGLLAFGLLLVFLRNILRALLVAAAAPVALAATLGFMHLAGVGLNLLSIGGLALGVGMLLDGSIVVLEAFQRARPAASGPVEAARTALAEVAGGLVCGALTTAVVLVPIVFMTGLAQRLFIDFAFTLVVSLGLSLAAALFLLPALLVWLDPGKGKAQARPRGEGLYGRFLGGLLRQRFLVLLAAAAILAGSAWIYQGLGASLLPEMNPGRLYVRLTLPLGSDLELLQKAVSQAEETLLKVDGVQSLITRAGVDPEASDITGLDPGRPNQALITVLADPGLDQQAILGRIRTSLAGLSGLEAEAAPAGDLANPGAAGFNPPTLIIITGPEHETLKKLGQAALGQLRQVSGLSGLSVQGSGQGPQLKVEVDRPSAALFGVSVAQVARTVRRAVQGEVAGELLSGDRRIDIRVRLAPQDRRDLKDLEELPLAAPSGNIIFLGQAARLGSDTGPEELVRYQRRPAAPIQGMVSGMAFSQGQDKALAAADDLLLPPGYEVLPGPEGLELSSSLAGLAAALLLALGLTYVILVVRFESPRLPLVVLLSLPLLAAGPAVTLWLMGISLSSLVMLGGVVLLGMAANAAILLVDYASRLRSEGVDPAEAVRLAGAVRAKPILLSVLTTVLGALPLALGLGSGAVVGQALALTVAAGLLTSLLGTLFVAPALLSLFWRAKPEEFRLTAGPEK